MKGLLDDWAEPEENRPLMGLLMFYRISLICIVFRIIRESANCVTKIAQIQETEALTNLTRVVNMFAISCPTHHSNQLGWYYLLPYIK